MNLRSRWTSYILHVTSFITVRKGRLINAHAFRAVGIVVLLIIAEAWLALISLPLYLVAEPLAERNQETQEYKIRRVITLSVVVVIVVVWALKLSIIGALRFINPAKPFQVETEQGGNEVIIENAALVFPRASVSAQMVAPQITYIEGTYQSLTIEGRATPKTVVVAVVTKEGSTFPQLFDQVADDKGLFSIRDNHTIFTLPEGKYTATVSSLDLTHALKSKDSDGVTFFVKSSWQERLFKNADQTLNIIVVVFIAMGIISVVLTSGGEVKRRNNNE